MTLPYLSSYSAAIIASFRGEGKGWGVDDFVRAISKIFMIKCGYG